MAAAAEVPVAVGGSATTARVYHAPTAHAALVLAHGAGAPQSHPWMVKAARALSSGGLDVVTFDFLYTAARRRAPDRPAVLEETWRTVLDAVRAREDVKTDRLFIGGKSMGGRIASQVAAAGDAGDIRGLVLLGYPLHPPGKPSQLRVAHLARLKVPALFVQGARDAFGTPEELAPFVASLPAGSRVHVIEGGDHSFTRPRSTGETIDAVLVRVADEVARFTS